MRKSILIFAIALLMPAIMVNAQQDSIWTLEKCISHALEKNIQVRKGELSNQRNQQYAGQAKAQRYPSLNAAVSQNYNWSQGVNVGQTGYVGVNGSVINVNTGVTHFQRLKAYKPDQTGRT